MGVRGNCRGLDSHAVWRRYAAIGDIFCAVLNASCSVLRAWISLSIDYSATLAIKHEKEV